MGCLGGGGGVSVLKSIEIHSGHSELSVILYLLGVCRLSINEGFPHCRITILYLQMSSAHQILF